MFHLHYTTQLKATEYSTLQSTVHYRHTRQSESLLSNTVIGYVHMISIDDHPLGTLSTSNKGTLVTVGIPRTLSADPLICFDNSSS